MKKNLRITYFLVGILLISSCKNDFSLDELFDKKNQTDDSVVYSEVNRENERLKGELRKIRNEQTEEQLALIDFMILFDSINLLVTEMQVSISDIESVEEISSINQHQILLENLNDIGDRIDNDQIIIQKLQNKLDAMAARFNTDKQVVSALREQLLEKTKEVEGLKLALSKANQRLENAEDQISMQEKIIDQQQYQLQESEQIIMQHEFELNKRYYLLISKKDMQIRPFEEKNIELPYRKGRIRLLNDDGGYCIVERSGDQSSEIFVKDGFWNHSKYLIINVGRTL